MSIKVSFEPARMPSLLSPDVLMSAIEFRTTAPLLEAKMPTPPPDVTMAKSPELTDNVIGLIDVNSTPLRPDEGAISVVRPLISRSV
ncbi:MAG TPA: hypothetical protein EYP98_14260 [Planctomycetes bacterium]|nr:hypothetical protein [Planctomycetota bacterium]